MTLFAVACAAMFRFCCIRRPWLGGRTGCSVSEHDAAVAPVQKPADVERVPVSTYFTVSLLFCVHGLIPDLRPFAIPPSRRRAARVRHARWMRGSARHWQRTDDLSPARRALDAARALRPHVVSFDFACRKSRLARRRSSRRTSSPARSTRVRDVMDARAADARGVSASKTLITMRHIHNIRKIMLATGMNRRYAVRDEVFYAW